MPRTATTAPPPESSSEEDSLPQLVGGGQVHRRGLLVRLGVWAAIAAGPLALFSSCSGHAVSLAAVRVAPASPSPASAPVGPAGYAQMFVALWLRADSSADDARARAVQAMAPGVALLTNAPGAQGARTVEQCATVKATQVAPGYWSVVVGVELDAGSAVQLRYFAVPVQVLVGAGPGSLGSMSVTAVPAEVAPPASASAGQSDYPASVSPTSALAGSASAFLAAYLAGSGDLSSLLSPGTEVAPLPTPPYSGVQMTQVSADRSGMDGAVPADGTVTEVLVAVTATDPAGTQWPLQYALRMRARAGRWEVAALEPGPLLAAGRSALPAQPTVVPGASPRSSPSAS